MDAIGIVGVLGIVVGAIATALGWLLIVTWPYPMTVLAVVGGPLVLIAGVIALRRSGTQTASSRDPTGAPR